MTREEKIRELTDYCDTTECKHCRLNHPAICDESGSCVVGYQLGWDVEGDESTYGKDGHLVDYLFSRLASNEEETEL